MNEIPPLPACCSALDADWPLPSPVPGAALISTYFDPALLAMTDFPGCGVEAPPSIQRSVAKRQAEYLAGRCCARAAMQRITGSAYVPAIGADRAPIWPASVCGSITHSHGWAAAIVAPQSASRGLGLDAEHLLSASRAERLAGEILNPTEMQRLAATDPAQRALLVTLTFSLKESLFKALYPLVLQRFYFEHAELLEWSPEGFARLRLLIDLTPEWSAGHIIDGQFCVNQDRLLSLISLPAV